VDKGRRMRHTNRRGSYLAVHAKTQSIRALFWARPPHSYGRVVRPIRAIPRGSSSHEISGVADIVAILGRVYPCGRRLNGIPANVEKLASIGAYQIRRLIVAGSGSTRLRIVTALGYDVRPSYSGTTSARSKPACGGERVNPLTTSVSQSA
jgi:hypothetical protein